MPPGGHRRVGAAGTRMPCRYLLDFVGLQDFVAVVVDDLHGDRAGRRRVEGAAARPVQRRPRVFVDLGLERLAQALVRVVGAGEVRVADEEALAVVVRVNEPTGDRVGVVGADLAGRRVVDVDAADLDLDLAVARAGRSGRRVPRRP